MRDVRYTQRLWKQQKRQNTFAPKGLAALMTILLCLSLIPGVSAGVRAADSADRFELEDGSILSPVSLNGGSGQAYSVEGRDYLVYIDDGEGLLTDDEEEALLADMAPVTQYGHAAFVTGRIEQSDYEKGAGDIYHSLFGTESGTLFMIDMNHRQLIIYSDGAVYKIVTKNYADTITDNVYGMARNGDYYGCASECFQEIAAILAGDKIAQPMRHITNAMLAVILAALILYFVTRRVSRERAAKNQEILSMIHAERTFKNGGLQYARKTRSYNPVSRSDDGGGGFGGGGGFSGGGSSGGGGSHGF